MLAPALAAAAELAGGASYAVTDERGVAVRFDEVPARVVSMLPSLTETVCELGQCDRLVGVDRFSNWPQAVERLPHLGGLDDVDVEAIVALRPDVVLLSRSARVTGRLDALGVKTLVLEPKTRDDVRRVIASLARLFALPDEQALRSWRRIDEAQTAEARAIPASLRGKRVYFEVSRGPYAASESSFIGQTLAGLGLRNIVPADLGPFPKLGPEFVVRADPDLIMLAGRHEQSLAERPGWPALRAVRENRVCRFTLAQIDVLVRPGPRLAEAARIMADCLREKGAPAASTVQEGSAGSVGSAAPAVDAR
ncbi:MAG: helical backbone metal receptor [Burkholderiaceae bacterium]